MTPETPWRSPKEKPQQAGWILTRNHDGKAGAFYHPTDGWWLPDNSVKAWAYLMDIDLMSIRPEPVEGKCGRCGESFSAGRPEGCHGFHEHPEVCAKSLHRQIQSVVARAEKAEAERDTETDLRREADASIERILAERDEARADVSKLGQLLEAERGERKAAISRAETAIDQRDVARAELRKIVEAGREWWKSLEAADISYMPSSDLHHALAPHMQQEARA